MNGGQVVAPRVDDARSDKNWLLGHSAPRQAFSMFPPGTASALLPTVHQQPHVLTSHLDTPTSPPTS